MDHSDALSPFHDPTSAGRNTFEVRTAIRGAELHRLRAGYKIN